MTRLVMLMVAVVAFGCTAKPSEEDCRKAITNMQVLMGTENLQEFEAVESQVRRCQGGAKKASVECAIRAKTLDDLRTCDFYKVPENAKGIGPGTGSAGSAAGSAGSAATGSAGSGTAGSAETAGSAAGSAEPAGSAAGSAGAAGAGSAAAGSGAAGSAAAGSAGSGASK